MFSSSANVGMLASIFLDAVELEAKSVKLCMIAALIELYMFIPIYTRFTGLGLCSRSQESFRHYADYFSVWNVGQPMILLFFCQ